MTYVTYQNYTDEASLTSLFSYASSTVPIFPSLILFAVFAVTTFGSFFAQRRMSGTGNFPASFTIGAFFTSVVGITMSFIPGMVSLPLLVTPIAATVIGFLWMMFSHND